jgi:hypothetical protein
MALELDTEDPVAQPLFDPSEAKPMWRPMTEDEKRVKMSWVVPEDPGENEWVPEPEDDFWEDKEMPVKGVREQTEPLFAPFMPRRNDPGK